MGIKDIDLNKDGVTLGDHMDNIKKGLDNLFDGDDTNSNNIFDRVSHQMVDSIVAGKIDDVVAGNAKDVVDSITGTKKDN